MLDRCENPDSAGYHRYGGRGITVCDRWHDLRLFVEDINGLLGPKPKGRSLDRIDNDGDYKPGNVRWATTSVQRNNQHRYNPETDWDQSVHRGSAGECWRPVPGYAGFYEVSDQGNVYSLGRPSARGGMLTPQFNPAGYRFVRLHKYGRVKTVAVGRLVLLAFVGQPTAPGTRAVHGDGGCGDDSLANLRWG